MTQSDEHLVPSALANVAPELSTFYRAWTQCRHGAEIPTLSAYLDAPPSRLQPFVSIVDLHAPGDIRIRLFGTGLVTLAGQDFTSRTVAPIYRPEDMAIAALTAWRATGHPAGYTCLRAVRTASGMILGCASICLPLKPAAGIPRSMVTYLHTPNELPRLAMGPDVSMISDFKFLDWIDIGAGVPSTGD